MAFGLILLLLTCIGSYFYFFRMNPPDLLEATVQRRSDHDIKLTGSDKGADEFSADLGLSDSAIGAMVQIKDVGLELQEFDGIITDQQQYKSGSIRWIRTLIDQGNRVICVQSSYREEGNYFVEGEEFGLEKMGLQKSQFLRLSDSEPESFQYESEVWQLSGKFSARFSRGNNHLEQIPCLIWYYEDQEKTRRIQVLTLPDQSVTAIYQMRISGHQVQVVSVS